MPHRLVRMVLTRGPQDPCWQLVPTVQGSDLVGLLGWVLDAPDVEAGVPEAVAKVLVRALCRLGTLTFPHESARTAAGTSGWSNTPEGWAWVVRPSGFARWFGKPAFPLVCTTDESKATQLFDAEGFAWVLQGQVGILTRWESSPPRLLYQDIQDLLNRKPLDPPAFASRTGALGLLVPAVDGDFAGWIACAEEAWNAFLEHLEQSCAEAGAPLDVVSEAAFQKVSWYRNPGPAGSNPSW